MEDRCCRAALRGGGCPSPGAPFTCVCRVLAGIKLVTVSSREPLRNSNWETLLAFLFSELVVEEEGGGQAVQRPVAGLTQGCVLEKEGLVQ